MDIFTTPRLDAIESKLKRAIAGEPEPPAAPSFAYAFWQAAGMWALAEQRVIARNNGRLRYDYKEFIRIWFVNRRVIVARYGNVHCDFCHDPIKVGQSILYQKEPRYKTIHADVETCLHSQFLSFNGLQLEQATRTEAIILARKHGDDAK